MLSNINRIPYLYAEDCKHCNDILITLEGIIKDKKCACKIFKIAYNDPEAIALAIKHNIDDLPAFIIGKKVFKGKNITKESIIETLKSCKLIKPSLF